MPDNPYKSPAPEPQLPPVRQAQPGQTPRHVDDYMVQSILCLVMCCWPLALPGLIKSMEVKKLVARGDYAGAEQASQSAKNWCIASFLSGFILIAIAIALQIAFPEA